MHGTSSTGSGPTVEQKARAFDALCTMLDGKAEFLSRRRQGILPRVPDDYMPGTTPPDATVRIEIIDTYQWILRAPTSSITEALLSLLPEFRKKP